MSLTLIGMEVMEMTINAQHGQIFIRVSTENIMAVGVIQRLLE